MFRSLGFYNLLFGGESHGAPGFLLTLAEVSVAIVAFVTIILVVRQSTGQQLSLMQVLVARALIEMALIALIFSLLPILVSYFGVTDSDLWQMMSGALALGMGLIWGFWPYRRHRTAKSSDPSPGVTYYTIVPLSLAAAGLSLANAFLWASFSIYALVLCWQLASVCLVFLWSLKVFILPTERS